MRRKFVKALTTLLSLPSQYVDVFLRLSKIVRYFAEEKGCVGEKNTKVQKVQSYIGRFIYSRELTIGQIF